MGAERKTKGGMNMEWILIVLGFCISLLSLSAAWRIIRRGDAKPSPMAVYRKNKRDNPGVDEIDIYFFEGRN